MREIYHIVPRPDWEQLPPGPFTAPSLRSEGFIHCAGECQVERVANRFYGQEKDLIVLRIDADALGDLLRDEAPSDDSFPGETFPHVYGEIDRRAILRIEVLCRDGEGRWVFRP